MIPPEGGEVYSSMEPGVRAIIYRRTFDEPAKVKIRVSHISSISLCLYHRTINKILIFNYTSMVCTEKI
jgi:hypothetical protein